MYLVRILIIICPGYYTVNVIVIVIRLVQVIVHMQYLALLPLIYVVSTDESTTNAAATEGPTTNGTTTNGVTTDISTTNEGSTTGKYIRTYNYTISYVHTYIHNCIRRIACMYILTGASMSKVHTR